MTPNSISRTDSRFLQSNPLNIVLYQPEIAANTGAVGRTCVGIGAKLWLVEPLGFQIDDRKLKRAGLDYWKALDWERVSDWGTLQTKLLDSNSDGVTETRFFFFSKKGKKRYDSVRYRLGDVLVFGSESCGLPDIFTNDDSRTLRIPIRPQIRSLNLSVSVAVVAFEAVRQLRINSQF